jgi:hypothetical protein
VSENQTTIGGTEMHLCPICGGPHMRGFECKSQTTRDERTFTLTEGELYRLLAWAAAVPSAQWTIDTLANTAHSRLTTREWLDDSVCHKIINYRGFPGLSGGAGDGNRTRIASLEGSDAAKG